VTRASRRLRRERKWRSAKKNS